MTSIDDFGRLTQGRASSVLTPRDVDELVRIIADASANHKRLTTRGRGLSQSGQSIPSDCALLDCSALRKVELADSHTVWCEGGATFRDVVDAISSHHVLPRVMPLNLDLSIGGVLSAGGVGPSSHLYGPVVSNVLEIDAVTGTGERVTCGDGDLFDAVRAGLGRCAVIARAKLALRAIKPRVRTIHLLYGGIDEWLADQRLLAGNDRIASLEGFCWASAKGMTLTPRGRRPFAHWLYGLQIGIEHDGSLDDSHIIRPLSHWRVLHSEDEPTLSFIGRYQPRFDAMKSSGSWDQAHPWLECFLPMSRAAALIPRALAALPLSLGDGHRSIMVERRSLPPLFAVPDDDVLCFAILPVGVAQHELHDVLGALRDVDRMFIDAGGKRYKSGWLFHPDDDAWRAHFGPAYESWVAAKQRYDPRGTFESVLFPRRR